LKWIGVQQPLTQEAQGGAKSGLKHLGQTRLLANGVGGMARFDFAVDHEFDSGQWAVPYFVVAFSGPIKHASSLLERAP
jgi:hypothetical protein